jgi:hypothetical protein
MSGVEISSTRLDSHGQRLTLLEKAATKSSGVPAAASGGTTGSGSDLSIDEGGGPARAGALHLSSDTGPGGGGTTLGAGCRGQSSGGGLGGSDGGGGPGDGGGRFSRECADD